MRRSNECEIFRKQIPYYNEGWLSDTAHIAMTRHLATCDACLAEVRADAVLCDSLCDIPDEDAPPTLWDSLQTTRDRARRTARVRRIAFAFGLCLVLVVAITFPLLSRSRPQKPVPVAVHHVRPEVATAEVTAMNDAHAALNASDAASDPTRSLVQLCALHQQIEAIR